jgi:phage gpG-like protein
MDVEITVFGEDVVRRRLLRTAGRMVDAREAFLRIARLLRRGAERQFASDGAYGGTPWPPLAASTQAQKARLGLDPRILRATHRLADSLTEQSHPDHVEEVGADHLRYGSRVPYGVFHQSSAPRTRLPFRPPLRLPEQDKRSAVRELQRAIMEG